MWALLAGLAALQVYVVRELLAALLLLAMTFAFLSGLILALFLVGRAGRSTMARAEATSRAALARARRLPSLLGELSRKSLRRLRSQLAP